MPSCPLAIRATFTRPERCARRDGHKQMEGPAPKLGFLPDTQPGSSAPSG